MCHVLIIEDEPLIADIISDILAISGATSFDIAPTQQQAVELAALNRPAVITSDVRLREGRGPLAVDEIHDSCGAIPTIFITAIPDECASCDHAVEIISKPFTCQALQQAFAKAQAAGMGI
ncbi:response regulator [Sphingomonas sp. GM_Shp_2]|uniref:response regulator n=1 Tax=Sphingomonas sp. GM_Shp_2 TaxID=2937380 RepID=UPI00226A96EB|nr:response regulator [Sphingomonas sp. GM_Shp_2]